MTESLIDALYERIEIKKNYLNKEKALSDAERAAWGSALEWCHNTLCALEEASDKTLPEMPDALSCEHCDD